MNTNASVKNLIQNLEDLFAILNEKYFSESLVKPVITISPNTAKTNALGWCTAYKAWKDTDDGEGYFEINICAEHLARPFEEVAGTMLHEMVHLFDLLNGVKDCSRGGTYHNAKFRDAAEAHGLTVEKDEKYGWSVTALSEDALETVKDYMDMIKQTSFSLYREAEQKEEKKGGKSNSRKYVCPCCGLIVRATKEVKVICADCEEMLQLED